MGGGHPVARRTRGRPGCPDPRESEHHQDEQAEPDSDGGHVQPEPDGVAGGVPGHPPHDGARDGQDGAEHYRHGSRDRQDDD